MIFFSKNVHSYRPSLFKLNRYINSDHTNLAFGTTCIPDTDFPVIRLDNSNRLNIVLTKKSSRIKT